METRCDVVVVGGGLLGLASARALARRGREVILLEQAEIGHEAGGSKGSCRIFRLGYDDPGWVSMAMRAREPWTELEDECGRRLLHPTPHLTFGGQLDAIRDAMREAGGPHEPLTEAEAAARFPGIAIGGPALLEPESCVIAADAALQALAAAVPDVRAGVTVTGIADDGRQVTVRTTSGPFTADAAVVCAGPWTGALLADGGIAVPSTPTLEQVGYMSSESAPDQTLPIVFICQGPPEPYGLPVPGTALYKIGLHHSGPVIDPDRQEQSTDPDLAARVVSLAERYLPGLIPELVQTERCVYDNSPDADFIVDRIGRIVIGSGTSGHGFKFGPLLGEWLADLATGGDPDPAARLFSLSRFATAGAH
jgi:sarcosine oxidase